MSSEMDADRGDSPARARVQTKFSRQHRAVCLRQAMPKQVLRIQQRLATRYRCRCRCCFSSLYGLRA